MAGILSTKLARAHGADVAPAQSWEEHKVELDAKLDAFYDEMDTDHSGALKFDEVQASIAKNDDLLQALKLAGKAHGDLIDALDADHDGTVTLEEFKTCLDTIGHNYSVHWLEEQLAWHQQNIRDRQLHSRDTVQPDGSIVQQDLGPIDITWALLFEKEKTDEGHPTELVSQETVEVVQNIWKLDLHAEMRISIDHGEILILVGIPHKIMREEAEHMDLQLRLKVTRGVTEYREIYHQWYARYPARTKPGRSAARAGQIFASYHKQLAVMHRLKRHGQDYAFRMGLPTVHTMLSRMSKRAADRQPLRAAKLKELLTAVGAYREGVESEMCAEIAVLAAQVLADPFFMCFPPEELEGGENESEFAVEQTETMRMHMLLKRQPEVLYEEVEHILSFLDQWCQKEEVQQEKKDKAGNIVLPREVLVPSGPGGKEVFVGSMLMFFPTHQDQELEFLKTSWGSWSHMWSCSTVAKPNEGGKTLAWGHPQNTPAKQTPGFLYQPIDEMRDYFGEQVTMYFSWLGLYTKALASLSVLGIITMVTQFVYESEPDADGNVKSGVDANPLTLFYSVVLSLWSVGFLSSWKRTEADHAFLWGSEGIEDFELPRPQFEGVVQVNKETGREELVYGNAVRRLFIKCFSSLVIVLCMLATAGCAFLATSLKYKGPEEGTFWEVQKWKLLSASLNLIIIFSFGMVYEMIALKLNNLENYRTETAFQDGLITKNFMFQFVNNYFILFYIAYLQQIKIDGFGSKACPNSCLSDLQMQLFVVFTGKTYGTQVVEIFKPFLQRYIKLFIEILHFRKMWKAISESAEHAAAKVLPVSTAEYLGVEENDADDTQGAREGKLEERENNVSIDDISDPYEQQTHFQDYEKKGTFDDFNEMAIQYGYVALFSPCFPLAPFFAMVNNIIEIRGDAWKLCLAFQRPRWRPVEDIGSWFAVLTIIGFIAVVTNATMITFVGSQLARDSGELEGITNRVDSAYLWICAVAVEHSVMGMRVGVLLVFPTYPNWIGDAKDVLRFRVKQMRNDVKAALENGTTDELHAKIKLQGLPTSRELDVTQDVSPAVPNPMESSRTEPTFAEKREVFKSDETVESTE